MKKILFAITTYNQLYYTKICIDSLLSIDNKDFKLDILVIDDFSDDDTVEWCKKNNINVYEKNEPKGLTHSWNKSIEIFKQKDYDYLVIANNDLIIPNGSLKELVSVLDKYPCSTVVPMSTKNGVGHNPVQDIGNFYPDLKGLADNPNSCQMVQDSLLDIKNKLKQTKDLFKVDPFRMKHFNGFFFMFNKNILKYITKDGWVFHPKNIMTKNEDEFNWQVLLPNNDNAWLCRTSFIYHYKRVSTYEQFDTPYGEVVKTKSSFLENRKKVSDKYK